MRVQRASDQSDSGLETIVAVRLSVWGVPMRQQVAVLGRPVDLLIGEKHAILRYSDPPGGARGARPPK